MFYVLFQTAPYNGNLIRTIIWEQEKTFRNLSYESTVAEKDSHFCAAIAHFMGLPFPRNGFVRWHNEAFPEMDTLGQFEAIINRFKKHFYSSIWRQMMMVIQTNVRLHYSNATLTVLYVTAITIDITEKDAF